MQFFVSQYGGNFLQANKNPRQYKQILDQEDTVNPCHRRIGPLGSNIVEAIALFALSKLSSIGIRTRYSCRRCAFRRFISSLLLGIIFAGRRLPENQIWRFFKKLRLSCESHAISPITDWPDIRLAFHIVDCISAAYSLTTQQHVRKRRDGRTTCGYFDSITSVWLDSAAETAIVSRWHHGVFC
jgi:hypothetical protein